MAIYYEIMSSITWTLMLRFSGLKKNLYQNKNNTVKSWRVSKEIHTETLESTPFAGLRLCKGDFSPYAITLWPRSHIDFKRLAVQKMEDWLNSDSILLWTGTMQSHWYQHIELRAEPDPYTCFGTQKTRKKSSISWLLQGLCWTCYPSHGQKK